MAEIPPTADFRGGKASEDSFSRLMTNLTVAYAVDFQADFFADAVPGLAVSSEDFWWLLCPILRTERNRSEKEDRPVLHKKVWLDESPGRKPLAYLSIPDRERSRDWTLTKSGFRFEDLESIPWDAA